MTALRRELSYELGFLDRNEDYSPQELLKLQTKLFQLQPVIKNSFWTILKSQILFGCRSQFVVEIEKENLEHSRSFWDRLVPKEKLYVICLHLFKTLEEPMKDLFLKVTFHTFIFHKSYSN